MLADDDYAPVEDISFDLVCEFCIRWGFGYFWHGFCMPLWCLDGIDDFYVVWVFLGFFFRFIGDLPCLITILSLILCWV